MDNYSKKGDNPDISSLTYYEGHIGEQFPGFAFRNIIDICLFIALIIGIILGTYLIYRKHGGEQGLWKKIFKRNFIYILILFISYILILFVLYFIILY